jgi:hypothetical protein
MEIPGVFHIPSIGVEVAFRLCVAGPVTPCFSRIASTKARFWNATTKSLFFILQLPSSTSIMLSPAEINSVKSETRSVRKALLGQISLAIELKYSLCCA